MPAFDEKAGSPAEASSGVRAHATREPAHRAAMGEGALRALARQAMLLRGLSPDFSPEALAQASASTRPATRPGSEIRDLRGLPWSSIDDPGARTLDQLACVEPLASGAVKLLVAIADVDATVPLGSPVDGDARARTASVSTAAGTFPMLPEQLSSDLTSFGEGKERLAVVVEMVVASDGTVSRSAVHRAVVVNHARLAYDDVAAWLDGRAPSLAAVPALTRLDPQLRLQDRLAQSMRLRRAQRGALDLQTSEARPVFQDGVLTELRTVEKNRARDLVEDLMLAANGATASYLAARGFPSFRRALGTPARWARLVALAAKTGERLPPEPSARALAAFLAARRQSAPDRFPALSLVVTKLLGPGEYAAEPTGKPPPGRFGLAVQCYTHSTAPSRRFPDLLSQRLLKAALAGHATPYDDAELAALAQHCATQEANAAKAERQVLKSAAALLLAPRVGERFDAVVTGASKKGTWVRIAEPPVEGRLVSGAEGLDVGDEVDVQLARTDAERGFIDFFRAR